MGALESMVGVVSRRTVRRRRMDEREIVRIRADAQIEPRAGPLARRTARRVVSVAAGKRGRGVSIDE